MHRAHRPFEDKSNRRHRVSQRRAARGLSRKLSVERLEARNLLAVVNLVDGNLVVTDPGTTNDSVTVLSDAANQRFQISDPGNLITTAIPGATGSGTNTVLVPFSAITGGEVQVLTLGGNDTIAISGEFALTARLNGGTGTNTLNLNNDATFAAGTSLIAAVEVVNVGAGADIVTSGAGTITLSTDAMAVNATATLVSASTITVQPRTVGVLITLGSELGGQLSLTDAELDRFTAGQVVIGNASSGALQVTAALTHGNHLSLISNGGFSIVNPITMAADKNFSIDSRSTASSVQFNSAAADITSTGSGAISIVSPRSIILGDGGQVFSTQNGGITLTGNEFGTTAGSFAGISSQGTITSTGTGNISLIGRGSGGNNGIILNGTIQSTSTANSPTQGKISLVGGGLTGVQLNGAFSQIISGSGDIEIVGTGGNNPGGSGAHGVSLTGLTPGVTATNGASVSITGTGGVANESRGILLQDGGSGTTGIRSQQGSITLRGTGATGATGNSNQGVSLLVEGGSAPVAVRSTSGAIRIEGTGGSGTVGTIHHGVEIFSGSTGGVGRGVVATSGAITVIGTPGSGTNSVAIVSTNNNGGMNVDSLSTIEFIGDSFRNTFGNVANAGGGTVTFRPLTAGLPISVGNDDVLSGSKRLGLTQMDLQHVFGQTIKIGDAASGDLTVDATVAPFPTVSRGMQLISGGNIVLSANLTTIGTEIVSTPATWGGLVLSPGPLGGVRPLVSPTDVTTHVGTTIATTSFAAGGDLEINIAGTTVNTQYNQLRAVGSINLAGADLRLTGAFVSALGNVFTIVSAADNLSATFNGLPENGVRIHNGRVLRVNYTATAVTLTDVGQPPTIDANSLSVSTGEGSPVINAGIFGDPDGNATATVSASVGTVSQNSSLGTWNWSLATTDGPLGPIPVTLTVTDVWGAASSVTFEYIVNNLPPTVSSAGSVTLNEGQTAANTGTWSDPGVDVVSLSASIGSVAKNDNGTWSWSLATSDGPDQTQSVTITATDSDGAQSQTSFLLTVNNVAPSVSNAGNVTVNESQTANNTGAWSDPGADVVTLAASVGTVVKNGDGTWSWSFSTTDGPDQSQTVTITATDSDGAQSQSSFLLTVNNVAPSVSNAGNVTVNESQTATNTGTWSDPGLDIVTLSASVGTVVRNSNGTWSWSFNTTDGPDQTQSVTITATDSDGAQSQTTFQLTVTNVAPSVSNAGNVTVSESQTATNSGTWSDPGADVVTLAASVGTVVKNGDGTWSWSFGTTDGPDQSQTVTISATDSDGAQSQSSFLLAVSNVAPTVVNAGNVIVNESQTATNTGTWSDPGLDIVTLSASIGTVIRNPNGTWSWSFGTTDGPDQTQTVTISATDSDGAQSQTSFLLTVNNVAPSVTNAGNVTVNESQTATNTGTWSDPGADVVTLAASVGTVVRNGDGTWGWSFGTSDGPDQSQTVTITATDSDGAQSQTSFTLTVNNLPPTLTHAGNVSVSEGQTANNAGTWDDAGADVVTLSASVGAITKNANGAWDWSFTTNDGPDQSQTVTITATDSDGGQSQTTFQLTVNNVAPSVASSGNVSISEGQTAANTGTWSDPGADVVTLSASSGTIIKNAHGTWDWSFETTDGPDQSQTVTITATDSDGGQTQTSFALVVSNSPPSVLTSSNVTVAEGQTAANTGTWSDLGNDIVTLSASVGTVTKNANGTWDWSYTTSDGPDQSQTVTITATDSDGDQSQASFTLAVKNVAPSVLVLNGLAESRVGRTASFTGSFSDPGNDVWHGEAELSRTGHAPVVVPIVVNADKSFSFSHEFSAAGVYEIKVTVFDSEAGTPESKSVTILVYHAGDYDRNGAVEHADYAFWKQYYGIAAGIGLHADGNEDGAVDAADYVVWRNNLGATTPAAGAAIPEQSIRSTSTIQTAVEALMSNEIVASIGTDGTFDGAGSDRMANSGTPTNSPTTAVQQMVESTVRPLATSEPGLVELSRLSFTKIDTAVLEHHKAGKTSQPPARLQFANEGDALLLAFTHQSSTSQTSLNEPMKVVTSSGDGSSLRTALLDDLDAAFATLDPTSLDFALWFAMD